MMTKINRRRFIKAASAAAAVSPRAASAQAQSSNDDPAKIAEIWVTNRDAQNAAESAIVELGVPLAPGILPQEGFDLAAFDGPTACIAQTDNHSIDMTGHVRWCLVTAIVSRLAAGETRRLTIQRIPRAGRVDSGLTAAQVAAALPDCIVELLNVLPESDGTTLVAEMSTGLGAGPDWARAQPRQHGAWRRGPACTEYIVSVPMRSNAVHPALRVWFHVAAYTVRGEVVNARVAVVVENGVSEISRRDNRSYFYDLKIQFGARRIELAPVSLGDFDVNGNQLMRVLGTIAPEHHGLTVVGPNQSWAARLVVPPGHSGNRVPVNLFGTVPNGRVRVEVRNVAHSPFSRFIRRLWTNPQLVFAHLAPSEWQGRPEHALGAYCKATMMVQNFAGEPETMPLAPLDALGTRPFATSTLTTIGHFTIQQGAPGDNPEIGAHPSYYLAGLFHHTPESRRLITDHADARMGLATFMRSDATGQFHRPDEGADLAFDVRWGRNHVGLLTGVNVTNQQWRISHWGAMFYIPYLVTGDFTYCEGLAVQSFMAWASARMSSPDNRACGNQMTRHDANVDWPAFYDARIHGIEWPQPREAAWAVRTTVHTLALFPDRAPAALLGWDKPMLRRLWENVQNNLHQVFLVASTGPGRRWFGTGNEVTRLACEAGPRLPQWMEAMQVISWGHGGELGVLNERGTQFMRWLMRGKIAPLNDYKFNPDYMIALGDWIFTKDGLPNGSRERVRGVPMQIPGQGEPARTPEEVYAATVQFYGGHDATKATPCTVSNSARPGETVEIVADRPVFVAPFEWYIGKTVLFNEPSDFRRARVTEILAADRMKGVMINELAGAPGQRYPNLIPCFPPPGTAPRGQVWLPGRGPEDWAGYVHDICVHATDIGIEGAREAWVYMITLKRTLGGPGRYYWGFKHSVEPR